MGLCMFMTTCTCFRIIMPSSLPLLHTAMPTPCLNAFWHSNPYIFLHFVRKMFFCLVHLQRQAQWLKITMITTYILY